MPGSSRRWRAGLWLCTWLVLIAGACSDAGSTLGGPASVPGGDRSLKISAIPDQDPADVAQVNEAMAAYLSEALAVEVEYVPVTDYAAAVSLFRTGDVDLVFFGGLTGVQARLQAPGATLVAQRDIDASFRTVFIANAATGIRPVSEVLELTVFAGRRFTFGSESSTSGRLMPQYFLDQAGVSRDHDFAGPPGFSGSHDTTVDLVQADSYEAGALNVQVWKARRDKGTVDPAKVTEVFTTPPYHDYHWMAGPRTDQRFGARFTDRIKEALLALDHGDPEHAELLDLYGAKRFIGTEPANYREIEQIARKLGLVG